MRLHCGKIKLRLEENLLIGVEEEKLLIGVDNYHKRAVEYSNFELTGRLCKKVGYVHAASNASTTKRTFT